MHKPTTFAQRLSRLLAHENLSVKELAERIGRQTGSIERYLKGTETPKVAVVVALVREFPHWSPDYLLADRGEPLRAANDDAPTPDYQTRVMEWVKVKQQLKVAIQTLPNEAHQTLWKECEESTKKLLTDLEAIVRLRAQMGP